MTMIKDIAPFKPKKAVTTIAFFHVPELVNPRRITVGSFPACVTREVNKNPLLTCSQKSLQDRRMTWLLPKLILKPSELFQRARCSLAGPTKSPLSTISSKAI